MGQVFEAQHIHTGARLAIKTLRPHLLDDVITRQRFLREARASVRIGHKNIVGVYDLDMDDTGSWPFIVQEFLIGETLGDLLDRTPGQRIDPRAALRILVPVMGALVGAHRHGVVHRDIKPTNIFLCEDAEVIPKLIDFGIAKVRSDSDATALTAAGLIVGSPEYMSPEQVVGDSTVDAQTDVWAMGVVLYEAITGHAPFGGSSPQDAMVKVLHASIPAVTSWGVPIDEDLASVIHGALERERSRRFPTMQALVAALLETKAWSAGTPPELDFNTTERDVQCSIIDDSAKTLQFEPTKRPRSVPGQNRGMPTWLIALVALALVAVAALAGRALGRAGM